MTTPNPQPGAAPTPSGAQSGSGNQYLQDAGVLAPVGGASGGSKYGLGATASMNVVGSPVPVNSANPTAEQVMEALAHADPATIAQMQAYLYKSGKFYKSSTRWQDLNLGVLGPDDLDAFAKAVSTAAQTGADLTDYIRRMAAWGVYTGATSQNSSGRGSGSSSSSTSGGILTIEKPDPKAIGQTIDKEFQKLLGHKPSAHERAGFIAAYTNAYQQVQIENYNAQVAAATGGKPGAEPISGSSAPPALEPEVEGAGNIGENMRFAEAASQNSLLGLLTPGAVPNPLQVEANDNYQAHERNQALVNQDNAFLSLADQPLPGMPGYSSGSGSAASSGVTTVGQQQAYDPNAFADEWIQQHHTAAAGAHSVTDVFSSFLNILHGGMS
jgi:hypothetical protein